MPAMGFIAWIVLGLIAGFIASKVVNRTGGGLLTDCILGIIGGLVGGWVANALHWDLSGVGVAGISLGPLIIAVLGSILVLVLYHMVFRRTV